MCAQIGGQEHFYLETNATLAVPGEAGSIEVFSSTQNPTKTQNFCAKVCGVDKNKVGANVGVGGGAVDLASNRAKHLYCCWCDSFRFT